MGELEERNDDDDAEKRTVDNEAEVSEHCTTHEEWKSGCGGPLTLHTLHRTHSSAVSRTGQAVRVHRS